MTETVLALVPEWGLWLIAATTFLSCLALPVPASLVMLAAGAFAAAGDLSLPLVMAAAFAGATLGDHAGFAAGRLVGQPLLAQLRRSPGRAKLIDDGRKRLAASAPLTVFLTRWLFSPLGPYVNLAAGASGLPLRRFTPADLAGEAVWAGVYCGLGFGFAGQISAVADVIGNASGVLAAGAVTLLLGLRLRKVLRARA
jgi:membrane-associated protein